ncbi:hypothetical protein [Cellulomonas sp. PhB150]|uniref:hypothetical protein n=1 Tax=Cellulomonas sp. PhB150 TaxID=2485188 RepID=UPI000F482BC4|nr:hypothetical protein [Cellulomonas sp. PhB150]
MAATAALAIAAPAEASTRLIDVQYGKACSVNDFYATVSAYGARDGDSKIDLTSLKFGAAAHLICDGITQICIDATVIGYGNKYGFVGSTPTGGIPLYFTTRSSVWNPSNNTYTFKGTNCYSTTDENVGRAVNVPNESGYVFTGGYGKLSKVTISSRARVLVSGKWHSSPTATQTYSG